MLVDLHSRSEEQARRSGGSGKTDERSKVHEEEALIPILRYHYSLLYCIITMHS